jgi:hypothetical protein
MVQPKFQYLGLIIILAIMFPFKKKGGAANAPGFSFLFQICDISEVDKIITHEAI